MTLTVHYEAIGVTKLPSTKSFKCPGCEAKFYTTNWHKTKKGYSAMCPCCQRNAWSKRG